MGKIVPCLNCKGLGETAIREKCEECNGSGSVQIVDASGVKKVRCEPCRGSGKVNDTDRCNMCGGAGEIEV